MLRNDDERRNGRPLF